MAIEGSDTPKAAGAPLVLEGDEKRAAQERIIDEMSDGKTLSAICRQEGMPKRRTVYDWINTDADFAKAMDFAREMGADAIADDQVEISDDGRNDWMQSNDPDNPGWRLNGENVQRSKLRIWTRQQLLEKWHPKKYGAKLTQELTGEGGGPIKTVVLNKLPVEELPE